jgi:hypothetical protein
LAAPSNSYNAAASTRRRDSPVNVRANKVSSQYEKRARDVDREVNGITGDAPGPMLLSLRSFGVCVGLVFGAFSEGSTAVHQLLKHAASGIAEAQ